MKLKIKKLVKQCLKKLYSPVSKINRELKTKHIRLATAEIMAQQKINCESVGKLGGEAVREVSRNWKLLPYITLIR